MKQAIIITAYKNFEQLDFLVDFFAPCFDVFIHVDKKSEEISKDKIALLNSKKNVYAIQKFNIKWGGKDHLNAILFLMEEALKRKGTSFIHVISGEDFPLVSCKELFRKFENEKNIFLSIQPIQETSKHVQDRFYYRAWPEFLDYHTGSRGTPRIIRYAEKLARTSLKARDTLLGYEFDKVYKGLVYVSLPADAAAYCVQFSKEHPKEYKALKNVLISEEFYFQTILMNSSFAPRVIANDLRYCDWEFRNGSSPANLDMSDYLKILESGKLFCRKITAGISDELKKALLSRLQ